MDDINDLAKIKMSLAGAVDIMNETNRKKEMKQQARDEDLHAIRENTSSIEVRVMAVTEKVNKLSNQQEIISAELTAAKAQCDTINVQLLEAQTDSQRRDIDSTKATKKAQITAYVSLGIAAVSMIAEVISVIVSVTRG